MNTDAKWNRTGIFWWKSPHPLQSVSYSALLAKIQNPEVFRSKEKWLLVVVLDRKASVYIISIQQYDHWVYELWKNMFYSDTRERRYLTELKKKHTFLVSIYLFIWSFRLAVPLYCVAENRLHIPRLEWARGTLFSTVLCSFTQHEFVSRSDSQQSNYTKIGRLYLHLM